MTSELTRRLKTSAPSSPAKPSPLRKNKSHELSDDHYSGSDDIPILKRASSQITLRISSIHEGTKDTDERIAELPVVEQESQEDDVNEPSADSNEIISLTILGSEIRLDLTFVSFAVCIHFCYFG